MCNYYDGKYDGLLTAEQARAEVKTPTRSSTGKATLKMLGNLVNHVAERSMRTLDLNMLTGFMTGFCGNSENMSLKRSMIRWLDINADKLESEYGYKVEQYRDVATGQLLRLVLIW